MIEILTFFLVISFIVYLLYVVYYTLDLFLLNPLERIPSLTEIEKETIAFNLPFYPALSPRLKKRYEKRVTRFRQRKKIIFHEEVQNQEEITLLLSATAVMLTLGMADFLILSVKRILVYPSSYYSRISKQHHHGEYHPGLKTLVFSAEHLREGFRIPNDSLNLAVHEFAHALSLNVVNKLNIRSFLFMIGMVRIKRLLRIQYSLIGGRITNTLGSTAGPIHTNFLQWPWKVLFKLRKLLKYISQIFIAPFNLC